LLSPCWLRPPSIVERKGIHTIAYATLPAGENFIALFEGDPAGRVA
jgi:hypothetical protein